MAITAESDPSGTPAIFRPPLRGRSEYAWLTLALVLGGWLLWSVLLTGWYPHDEGALGQSAERVLAGEVPHRDFDEIYTGLLSYLHALAFKLGGIRAPVLRYLLFGMALAWMGTCFFLTRRFLPPAGAAAVTILVLAWSVPIYPAALPSWYILFCATWSAWALVRWHERGQASWLMLGGAFAGLAVVFKLTGIFLILGGLLALWNASRMQPQAQSGLTKVNGISLGLAVVGLSAVAGLWAVAAGGTGREFVRFVLPTGLILTALSIAELKPRLDSARQRWDSLRGAIGPFVAGAMVPLAAFVIWYAALGGLAELFNGVLVAPLRRVDFAAVRPPVLRALFGAVLPIYLLWPRVEGQDKRRRLAHVLLVGAALAVLLLATGQPSQLYRYVWWSGWVLPILLAVLAAMMVLGRESAGAVRPRALDRHRVMTLTCVAVPAALVEFPFAAPIYTHYAIPLAIIAVVAISRTSFPATSYLQALTVAFYLLFALLRLVPSSVDALGYGPGRTTETAVLDLPRAGLVVRQEDATMYRDLISFLVAEGAGRRIWAGPDAPEVYFLSGQKNHTRVLFEFLATGIDRGSAIPARADEVGASMVVLNTMPAFSPPPDEGVIRALGAVYPNHIGFGKFLVLWR